MAGLSVLPSTGSVIAAPAPLDRATAQPQRQQAHERGTSAEILAVFAVERPRVSASLRCGAVSFGTVGAAATLTLPTQRLILGPETVAVAEHPTTKHARHATHLVGRQPRHSGG